MDGNHTERIRKAQGIGEAPERELLAKASEYAGRVLGAIQAIAGTTTCKGVQLVRLKQWAQEQGVWIFKSDTNGKETYVKHSPRASAQQQTSTDNNLCNNKH